MYTTAVLMRRLGARVQFQVQNAYTYTVLRMRVLTVPGSIEQAQNVRLSP